MNLFRRKVHSLSASSASEEETSLRLLSEQTRLASALLTAGLNPRSAAEHADLVVDALATSRPGSPEAFLAELWSFTMTTGAPPAAVLEVCSEAFTAAAENARQARVHLSGPQAATRLVMGLPLLAIAGGMLAGYNSLGFLVGSALGWAVIVVATGLMFLSHRWSARMVNAAQQWNWARGMAAEALAISLAAGQPVHQARAWAGKIAKDYSRSPEDASRELAQCDRFVEISAQTGVALAGLMRGEALMQRHAAREEAQVRVERLSVQLMIPLGVCVLPAFIAVGVLPLVASVISSTALNS